MGPPVNPHEPAGVVSHPLAHHVPPESTQQDGGRFMLLTTRLDHDLVGFGAPRTTAAVRRTVPMMLVGTASREHVTVP